MDKIIVISFNIDTLDCESILNQIEEFTENYLSLLENMEQSEDPRKLGSLIENGRKYTDYLTLLIGKLTAFGEVHEEFQTFLRNSYQHELKLMESIFLTMKAKVSDERDFSVLCSIMQLNAVVLNRMLYLLKAIGFEDHHEDVLFVMRLIRIGQDSISDMSDH